MLIKSHQNSTVDLAWLVAQCVPGIRVYGGLVLNETVGGLNPAAARLALALGARQVWMPTRSARNHRVYHGQPKTPPRAEGLRLYAERLRSAGFSVDHIGTMMPANPQRLPAPSQPICQKP